MSENCGCEIQAFNTGVPSDCLESISVVRGYYLVYQFDSTGARNKVTTSDTIDDAFVIDKINEADATKRWYPLIGLEEVAGERADSVFKTSAFGTKKYVKKGIRSEVAQIWKGGFALQKNLDRIKCKKVAVYEVDADGKLIGMVDGANMYPIRIQDSTFDAKYFKATATDPEYWNITFDWDAREMDYNLGYIVPEADCDLLSYNGLLDVVSTISGISQTGFTVTLETKFGAFGNKDKVSGLAITDFYSIDLTTNSKVYNVTDAAAVTIATFTETSDGVYAITFTSQTVADVIKVIPIKNGYDFSDVVTNTVTIA